MSVSNKQSAQLAQLKQMEEELSKGSSVDDLYKSYEGGEIIPIFTPEQFALVGTGETAYVEETGKIYTYTTDKTYMFYGQSEDITNVINGIVENKVTEIINNTNYITEEELNEKVEAVIANNNYVTETQIEEIIVGKGYVTSSQLETAIVDKGYITQAGVTSALANYATKSDLSSLSTGISDAVQLFSGTLTGTKTVSSMSGYKYILITTNNFINQDNSSSSQIGNTWLIPRTLFDDGAKWTCNYSGEYGVEYFQYKSATSIYCSASMSNCRIYGIN